MDRPLELVQVPFHEVETITVASLQLHSVLANATHNTRPATIENFSGSSIPQIQARPKLTYFRKTPGIYQPILKP